MASIEIKIKGMECDACVAHVTRALQALPGASSARVSLADKSAAIEYDAEMAALDDFRAAIRDEGYDVVE